MCKNKIARTMINYLTWRIQICKMFAKFSKPKRVCKKNLNC